MDNKLYIASLSYGKDSLAMIHVIRDELDMPLDRIITADVWATDTIPAELPPMVEFKEKADRIIKERWGIEVEHLCATRSFQMPLNVGDSKWRQKVTYQSEFYRIRKQTRKTHAGKIMGFPFQNGAWCNDLKRQPIMSFIQRLDGRWCNI